MQERRVRQNADGRVGLFFRQRLEKLDLSGIRDRTESDEGRRCDGGLEESEEREGLKGREGGEGRGGEEKDNR